MSVKFRHVGLIGRYSDALSGASSGHTTNNLQTIADFLIGLGCDVSLELQSSLSTGLIQYPALDMVSIGKSCDVAVVVGGDGTMLGAGRVLAPFNLPLIGINQGRLGFITDIPLDNFREALAKMIAGEVEEDPRTLLQGALIRDGEKVYEAVALNDVVVSRGAAASMLELRVEVDGHFVASHRADGLIVSTPTGATAYALSAGGPLLHPSVGGWALVPIAPHNLSNRPIVLPDDGEISLEIVAAREASASFDMQSITSLLPGDRITVRRAKFRARFLHAVGWNYFDILRNKLHWNAKNA